jgi:hypothetical protein
MSVALLLAASLAGCSPATSLPGFPEDLVIVGGCGDVILFAANPDDTLLLEVRGSGLVALAEAAGEPSTFDFVLPSDELTVSVDVGERVSDATCDDAIVDEGPRVDQAYEASAGTVTLSIVPSSEATGAVGSAFLRDVQFPSGPSHLLLLDEFSIEEVAVGWLPG